jgi:cold shock protein
VTDRTTGTVKFFSSDKGYGFLRRDGDNAELFVHKKNVHHQAMLETGQRVSFVVAESKKGNGLAAIDVRHED